MAGGLFGGGDGSKSNPFLVEDFADFEAIKNHLVKEDVYFQQRNDIEFNYEGDWHPIGDYANGPFGGVYDGAGYKIPNVISIAKEGHPGGLFGFISNTAILKNTNVVNITATGTEFVGGLVGHQQGLVEKCTAIGEVNGNNNVGGLIGFCQRSVTQCSSRGAVKGKDCVGGLIGRGSVTVDPILISDSYAVVDVTGTETESGKVGGLIGETHGIQIANSFSQGKVRSDSIEKNYVGGLLGSVSETTVLSSYYDLEKSGMSDVDRGTPKTTAALAEQSTFVGWDFDEIWKMENGRPWLIFEQVIQPPVSGLPCEFYLKISGRWFRLNPTN